MQTIRAIKHSKTYGALESLWSSQVVGWFLISIFVAVFICWLRDIPTPGKAVGILGVGAAVMTFRDRLSALEKFVWMAVLFGLLLIELKSINKDRAEGARAALKARNAQDQAFKKVLDQEHADFLNAIGRMNSLTDLSQRSLSGINNSIAVMTGGPVFQNLFPQCLSPLKNRVMPMSTSRLK
jgi:hypothetical protein